jgi:TetR/AcrR family transcriptional regulator, tetracycline repressor protein
MGATRSSPAKRPVGRPPKISRERVVQAGAAIAREQGSLDAVSIRAVAERLDVAPVSLYGHVASLAELLDLVAEILIRGGQARVRWPDRWDAILVTFARSFRKLLISNPAVLDAFLRRPVLVPTSLGSAERVLAALVDAGLSDDDAVDAYVLIHALALASASRERHAAAADDLAAVATDKPALAALLPKLNPMYTPQRFESAVAFVVDSVRPRVG